MFKKILTTLFGLTFGAGLLMIVCVAGASDANTLDFEKIKMLFGVALALMGVGFVGIKATDPDS